MSLLYLLLALIWIAVDFTALIVFYFYTGFWTTIALMAGTALLGVFLFKLEMGGVWKQFKQRLSLAALPGAEAADGLLLFTATCLLIAPFPLMDCVGLVLMIPPLRRFLARRLRNWIVKRFEPGANGFVFQMGGISAQGWPPPDYVDPLADPLGAGVVDEAVEDVPIVRVLPGPDAAVETDSEPAAAAAPATATDTATAESSASTGPVSLADQAGDEIEEVPFRSVPSDE